MISLERVKKERFVRFGDNQVGETTFIRQIKLQSTLSPQSWVADCAGEREELPRLWRCAW